jgi:hypothetical protein
VQGDGAVIKGCESRQWSRKLRGMGGKDSWGTVQVLGKQLAMGSVTSASTDSILILRSVLELGYAFAKGNSFGAVGG